MSSANCEKGCMLCYRCDVHDPSREEGTQYYPSQLIDGEYFDVLFLHDGENLTTLLYPLKRKQAADAKRMVDYDLTKREQEIVRLIIAGHSNSDIASKLFVSKATVKKHVNNIYKKLPASILPR
ncbi:MAG: helix-turn-helix transcriptional regulator [Planctomycetaceae bacterium]|nr:helix-turn-helix transcriptional regulator [Planctomycetaceae bacterium]